MAVPPISAPIWRQLAAGGLARIRTSNVGTQMMTKRLQMSGASLESKALEIHTYYSKWERGLTDEIAQFT